MAIPRYKVLPYLVIMLVVKSMDGFTLVCSSVVCCSKYSVLGSNVLCMPPFVVLLCRLPAGKTKFVTGLCPFIIMKTSCLKKYCIVYQIGS